MKENEKLPFDIDEIVRSLPPRQECADVASRNRAYIDMCVDDFRKMIEADRSWTKNLADLTISLARSLQGGIENVAKWADSIIPSFDFAAAPNYAYATRAAGSGGSDVDALTKLSFEKPGDGCSLKLDMEISPLGANIKTWMVDAEGRSIHPFVLTVVDTDSGEVLLSSREFNEGAAKLNGVGKGNYELVASAKDMKCEFSLAVE